MTHVSPRSELTMREAFKQFNRFMICLQTWSAPGNQHGPRAGGRIMVLLHTGRKSGRLYRTPVNYAEIDGWIDRTVGFGHVSDWYRNALAASEVELWLPDRRWRAMAEDVSEAPNRLSPLREGSLPAASLASAGGA